MSLFSIAPSGLIGEMTGRPMPGSFSFGKPLGAAKPQSPLRGNAISTNAFATAGEGGPHMNATVERLIGAAMFVGLVGFVALIIGGAFH